MGNESITINYVAIAGAILTAAAGLLGWLAKAYLKRMDDDMAEVIGMLKQSEKRSSKNFQAINGQLEKLDGKIDSTRKELDATRKELDKKGEKRHRETRRDAEKLDGKIDSTRKELDEKGEKRHRETRDALQKLDGKVETLRGETRDSLRDVDKKIDSTRKELDEKGEKRHGETRDALQKLNGKVETLRSETWDPLRDLDKKIHSPGKVINRALQGGWHEGPRRVTDDSAARLGQHSPRRIDEPSSTRDVEADPEQDAVHTNISMVPVPGSGTEPAHAPGLMHQAAPGPEQARQRVDETGTEPDADESAETAP